jgi:hypothetical protein
MAVCAAIVLKSDIQARRVQFSEKYVEYVEYEAP